MALKAMDFQTCLDGQTVESLFPECVLETLNDVDYPLFLEDHQSGFNICLSPKSVWKPEPKKTENENDLSLGLDWMDEKMDLSILDCPESLSGLLDDPLAMDGVPDTLLDSLTDFDPAFTNNIVNSQPKKSENVFITDLELFSDQGLENSLSSEPSSPVSVVPNLVVPTGLKSPQGSQNLSQPNSPEIILDGFTSENNLSSGGINVIVFINDGNSISEPISSPSSPELVLSDSNSTCTTISDVYSSSDELACVTKKEQDQIKPLSSPAQERPLQQKSERSKLRSKSASSSALRGVLKEGRRERKRVQNKEAAARYRVKKRNEGKALHDEVSIMEDQNKKLNVKVQQLTSEIKYLKNLMKEMFKTRGLLK